MKEEKIENNVPVTGLLKWIEDYKNRIRDESELQAEVNQYLADFDAKKEEIKEEDENNEWTLHSSLCENNKNSRVTRLSSSSVIIKRSDIIVKKQKYRKKT
uniref:CSON014942 protein n=1 Tax=Culicoides sonorensis TaxID=179676 RepID=A0A336KTU5_CULSO